MRVHSAIPGTPDFSSPPQLSIIGSQDCCSPQKRKRKEKREREKKKIAIPRTLEFCTHPKSRYFWNRGLMHTPNPVIPGTYPGLVPPPQNEGRKLVSRHPKPDLLHTTKRGTLACVTPPKTRLVPHHETRDASLCHVTDMFPTTKRRTQACVTSPKTRLVTHHETRDASLCHVTQNQTCSPPRNEGRKRVSRHPKPDLFPTMKRETQACVTSPKTRLVPHHETRDTSCLTSPKTRLVPPPRNEGR